jgi:predicted TIM-barrel fold metal-dependent hydrolase
MTNALVGEPGADTRIDEPLIVVSSDTHVSPSLEGDLLPYLPAAHRRDWDDWLARSAAQRAASEKGFVFGGNEDLEIIQRIHTWNLQTDGQRDVHQRLRDMDRDGVAGEVIFHGSAPFRPIPFLTAGMGVAMQDLDLIEVGQHMYNQWLADFCSVEPERHIGLAYLPMWDVDKAIEELRWARERGLRGVNFPQSRAEIIGYEDPVWEPFWSACEDLGVTLATHGGGGASTPAVSGPMALHIYMAESNQLSRISPAVRLVFSGVFERHPKLKLVQTEQQGAWYGDVLKELDSRWLGFRHQIGDGVLRELPSFYLRRQYFQGASFHSRFEAESAIREGYIENVIWGSDYPHPEGTYHFPEDPSDPDEIPMTHLAMRNTYHGLPAEPVRKMLGENGVRVYGFDGDELRRVADRINAPTLDELSHPLDARPTHWGFAFRDSEWLT